MAKYGFLEILDEEMGKSFPFDYEINWDKKNHAVEVAFLLEVQNPGGVETVDADWKLRKFWKDWTLLMQKQLIQLIKNVLFQKLLIKNI